MLLVIGGSSRTGTTLMSEFLSRDSAATNYLPECAPLQRLLEAYDRSREVNNADRFFGEGGALEFYRETTERFLAQIPMEREPEQTLVLKCPTMTPVFGCLDELIEGGRYLVMIRDPRDIVTSQIKVSRRQRAHGVEPTNRLHASEDVARMSLAVLRIYERLFREAAPQLGDRLLLLRYEDLTGDPGTAMRRLREFTGLALDHSPERQTKDSWGGGFRTELSDGPFSSANVGSHREHLTPAQIELVERTCAPFMKMFGYEASYSSANRAFSASMSASSSLENRIGGRVTE